jgi:uncharacterized protein (TIGR02145 family)
LILPNVSLCVQEDEVHYNPIVDPCASEKVKTTYEWVEIGGIKWATKNVGAKTITDYGQYFSWGGVNGFTADQVTGDCHSKRFSWVDYEFGNGTSSPGATGMTKYNSTDGKTVLEAEDDAATVNMGSGWRMPTTAEFQDLGNACKFIDSSGTEITSSNKLTTLSGVTGIYLEDKTDSSKRLFFPTVGSCYNGGVYDVGSCGLYWSSSLFNSSNKLSTYYLYFDSVNVDWQTNCNRCYGRAIRGVVG